MAAVIHYVIVVVKYVLDVKKLSYEDLPFYNLTTF